MQQIRRKNLKVTDYCCNRYIICKLRNPVNNHKRSRLFRALLVYIYGKKCTIYFKKKYFFKHVELFCLTKVWYQTLLFKLTLQGYKTLKPDVKKNRLFANIESIYQKPTLLQSKW